MFIGLDVDKETIDVSIADSGRHGEVRHYGVIASDLEPLNKVVRALQAPHRRLHFVYEAEGFGGTAATWRILETLSATASAAMSVPRAR
jgi:hypothetical protein